MCSSDMSGTTTRTGLTVRAAVVDGTFEKGQKVSDDQMQQLNIEHQSVCSRWNYPNPATSRCPFWGYSSLRRAESYFLTSPK